MELTREHLHNWTNGQCVEVARELHTSPPENLVMFVCELVRTLPYSQVNQELNKLCHLMEMAKEYQRTHSSSFTECR